MARRVLLGAIGAIFLARVAAAQAPAESSVAPQQQGPPPASPVCEGQALLSGVDNADRLALDAVGGYLLARLRLDASPAQKVPRVVRVAVGAAGRDHHLKLALASLPKSAPASSEVSVTLAPGSHEIVELSGDGFRPGLSNQGSLTVVDCEARVFAFEVTPRSRSLGLLTTDLAPEPVAVTPLGQSTVTACLPVDADVRSLPASAIRVSVSPLAKPADGEQEIRREDISVVPASASGPCGGRLDALQVSVGPLPAGKYGATLKINEQDVALHAIVRNSGYIVVLLLSLGFGLVVFVREVFGLQALKSRNTERIADTEAAAERALQGIPARFKLDELRIKNQLRAARACNRLFRTKEVDKLLELAKSSIPSARAPITVILDTIYRDTLPAAVRRDVDRELKDLQGIVDSSRGAWLATHLSELELEAKTGFRNRLTRWLRELHKEADPKLTELDRMLTNSASWLADHERADARAAVYSLKHALQEARELVAPADLPASLERPHVELLVRILPTLDALRVWLDGGPRSLPRPDLIAIAHGDLRAMPVVPSVPPAAAATASSEPAKVTLVPSAGARITTARELTISVLNISAPHSWRIERRRLRSAELMDSFEAYSDRLTYVFEEAGEYQITVTSLADKGSPSAPQRATLTLKLENYWSPVVQEEIRNLWMRVGVVIVALPIAALAAVAFFWTDRGFGTIRDYIAVFSAGIGANVGLGATAPFIETILKRLTNGGATPEAKDT